MPGLWQITFYWCLFSQFCLWIWNQCKILRFLVPIFTYLKKKQISDQFWKNIPLVGETQYTNRLCKVISKNCKIQPIFWHRKRLLPSRSRIFHIQLLPAESTSAGNYFPQKAFPQVITSRNRIWMRDVPLMKKAGNLWTKFSLI